LKRGRAHRANDLFNGFPFIETGDNDGDFHWRLRSRWFRLEA
jgi:hypothetical protein